MAGKTVVIPGLYWIFWSSFSPIRRGSIPSWTMVVIARGIMKAAFWMSNAPWIEMELWFDVAVHA